MLGARCTPPPGHVGPRIDPAAGRAEGLGELVHEVGAGGRQGGGVASVTQHCSEGSIAVGVLNGTVGSHLSSRWLLLVRLLSGFHLHVRVFLQHNCFVGAFL